MYTKYCSTSSLAHASSTTTCHTCCMRNCTGSTSQNVSSTNWESRCTAVCSTRLRSTWSTSVHQSQTFTADVIYSKLLDITWPYHMTGSVLSDCAFSVVGPTVWNSLLDSCCDPAPSSNSFRQSLKMNLFCRYHSAHSRKSYYQWGAHWYEILLPVRRKKIYIRVQ